MLQQNRKLTLGVPVRNEEENIESLILVLEKLSLDLNVLGVQLEIVINDNCSSDNSYKLLEEWSKVNSEVVLKKLQFPVSFQDSILKMMELASGDAFVVFQSDLQDPPDIVLEFVRRWQSGASIVAGVAIKRSEGWLDRVSRKIFYFLLKKFSDGHFIQGFQDFYLVSRPIFIRLVKMPKYGAFIRGHLSSSFGSVETVEYIRNPRVHGDSKFNFASKYSLALDGLLLFGTKFIRLISVISFTVFGLSTLCALLLMTLYVSGFRFGTHGWASQVLVLLSVLSLFGLVSGLILEYLMRIYRLLILPSD